MKRHRAGDRFGFRHSNFGFFLFRLPRLFHPAAPLRGVAVVPGFDGRQHVIPLLPRGPDGFVLLQADFVVPFAVAILIAAKMGRIRDPKDAIKGDVLVVNQDKQG